MKKTLLAIFVTLAMAAPSVFAREISSDEAGRAAAEWVRRDAAPLGAALSSADVAEVRTTSGDGVPIFHIVRMAGGGVVVTSAESGATPVIAFFDGDVPAEDNPLWKILRADMAARTEHVLAVREGETQGTTPLRSRKTAVSASAASSIAAAEAAWAALLVAEEKPAAKGTGTLRTAVLPDASGLSDLRVAPLLSTTWYQTGNAANHYTPPGVVGDPGNYPCGCVALVGAQIANFWRYPTASMPQVDRLCWVDGVSGTYRTMGGLYDWQNMPADFSSLTDDQKRAVGRLCYDFGVATQMEWGPGASGTVGILLADAFRNVFGYAGAVAYFHENNGVIPDALVERAILANLDAKCPVAVGLYGHEAVADGYGYASGTLYTHVNLGWGGAGNAWYNLPEIEVDESGISYSSAILDAVVFNIHPTATGELLTGRVLDGNGDPVGDAPVTAVSGGATISGMTDAHGIYALRVAGGRQWTVVATDGSLAGSRPASVGLSSSAVCEKELGGARIVDSGTVGNSWGSDISLGVGDVPIFVDSVNGSDGNDGRSWTTAKASIQAAIDIVEGNATTNAIVLVADGRYEPITATNNIPFSICSVNGPEATIIDSSLQWERGVTNRCATLGGKSDTNTFLSGFCLTNGIVNGVNGGGSFAGTLENCVLAGNTARNGAVWGTGGTIGSFVGNKANGTIQNCRIYAYGAGPRPFCGSSGSVTGGELTAYDMSTNGLPEVKQHVHGATKIRTAEDLFAVTNNLAGIYALDRDIDLGGATISPIGQSTAFSGEFYGQNHRIYNFVVNSTGRYTGLFGQISGGRVNGVRAEGTVTGAYASSGSSTGTGGFAGLIGSQSLVDGCSFQGAVTNATTYNVGGFVGRTEGAPVLLRSCCAGTVAQQANGSACAGGFVGDFTGGYIMDCYAIVDVKAGNNRNAAGFAGSASGRITTSWCAASVEGTGNNRGAFAGYAQTGYITKSYYDSGKTALLAVNNAAYDGITPLTSSEMLHAESFNFDFMATWRIDEGETTPYLRTFLIQLTGFTAWLDEYKLPPDTDPLTVTNGIPLIARYVYGIVPMTATTDINGRPLVDIRIDATGAPVFELAPQKNADDYGLIFSILWSRDLSPWQTLGEIRFDADGDGNDVLCHPPVNTSTEPHMFFKYRLTIAEE